MQLLYSIWDISELGGARHARGNNIELEIPVQRRIETEMQVTRKKLETRVETRIAIELPVDKRILFENSFASSRRAPRPWPIARVVGFFPEAAVACFFDCATCITGTDIQFLPEEFCSRSPGQIVHK